MASLYKEKNLEILIATQDRASLDFLLPMFPFGHFSNFNILIVNQSKSFVLESDFPSVRVINSIEVGLPKSRNLAINNAIREICIIADDDVVYVEDFDKEIVEAFNSNTNASVITFNHQRMGLDYPQNNNKVGYWHNRKTIRKVCSIEIAFKLNDIKNNGFFFYDHFGLGSYFETADEFLFLRNMLNVNKKLYYNPNVVVYHPLISSGESQGADRIVFARGALNYKLNGYWAYLWLIKYVFFLYRNKYINSKEWVHKIKIGLSGINKYKELEKEKNKK
jgi:hypothetical protein